MSFSHWVNSRLPINRFVDQHLRKYYAPKNLNFWYFFGSLAMLCLSIQILSGIFLLMYYEPTAETAFDSIEYMMREVPYGWLLRYVHAVGASSFFVILYLHLYRALMYGSYQKPRELLWLIGVVLLILAMAESYTGYVLPWGQMSYWAAKVIMSIFGAIPFIGEFLMHLIQGDYVVSEVTLQRFFAFHVVAFPLILLLMVFFHLAALHTVGSNNPDGIEIKDNKNEQGIPKDGVPFHPYFTVKDLVAATAFLIIFFGIVFYNPTMEGFFLEKENFIPANPLVTPPEIKPSWYLAPYYAILRAVPNQLWGAIAMIGSIFIFAFMPWLDRSPVRSMRYRGVWSRVSLAFLVGSFLSLMVLGLLPPTPLYVILARISSVIFFGYFITLPFVSRYDKHLTPPDRVRM
jgi:ubiquinol-cytochrome c reductase cytochrome b subunit